MHSKLVGHTSYFNWGKSVKVFISWSGARSKALACALQEWLPLILQYAKPWVSEKDISAGERWAQAIAGELESSNFGILCITPENLRSEWIMFEAGALSKSMLDAKVIPLLFSLELSDLSGPLSQFQALKVDQQGLMDVVKAINSISEIKAPEATISQLVPALWPQLQHKIDAIPNTDIVGKNMRPQTEILEDLVSQVRGLGNRMREFDPDSIDRDQKYLNRGLREIDFRMIDDLIEGNLEVRNPEVSLLILAGILRDGIPWYSEVLVESYRELKTAGLNEISEIAHRLMRLTHMATRSRYGERFFGKTKTGHTLMREIPIIIDRALSTRASFLTEYSKASELDSGSIDLS